MSALSLRLPDSLHPGAAEALAVRHQHRLTAPRWLRRGRLGRTPIAVLPYSMRAAETQR